MWFDDDGLGSRVGRRGRGGKSRAPVLKVSTQYTRQQTERSFRVGAIILAGIAVLGIGGLLWAGVVKAEEYLFTDSPRYTIRKLDIRCDGNMLTPELVEQQLRQMDVCVGTNLFAFDIGEVRRGWLREAPYLKSVELSRLLPDTVVVRVTERLPAARLGKWRHRYFVVDKEGRVFFARRGKKQLPVIVGYSESRLGPGSIVGEGIRAAVTVLDVCRRAGLDDIIRPARFDVEKPARVVIDLEGRERCTLAWESTDDLSGRLKFLSGVLRRAERDGQRVRTVDLTLASYRKNCAVTYR
jgi:hypothetical protein